jgi:hypothetical protein
MGALILVPISAVALLKNKLVVVVFKNILFAYNSDKHQTVYNTCGRNERIYAPINIDVSAIFLLKRNLEVYCILETASVD